MRRPGWLLIAGCALVGVLATGCEFGNVAFTPDGKRYAVAVYGDEPTEPVSKRNTMELWVTDVEGGANKLVVRSDFLGPSETWSADGKSLWFVREEAMAWKVSRWDGAAVADVATVGQEGDAVSSLVTPPQPMPDGSALLFIERARPGFANVVRIDSATGAKTILVERAAWPVLSPKGDRFACIAWEGEYPEAASVCIVPVKGGERRALTTKRDIDVFAGDVSLVWSRDGKRVAWVGFQGQDGVYVGDADGGEPRLVTPAGEKCALPVFAADGASVFYSSFETYDGRSHVRRVNLKDGTVTPVPGGDDCLASGVSPDGRFLAMQRRFRVKKDDDRDTVVRLVNLATGETRDDFVNARQRRKCAAWEMKNAERGSLKSATAADVAEAAACVKRAEQALDAMAKEFPGSEKHPDVAELRQRIALLTSSK